VSSTSARRQNLHDWIKRYSRYSKIAAKDWAEYGEVLRQWNRERSAG
jgi:hypothetical protein